jgi:predicted permease
MRTPLRSLKWRTAIQSKNDRKTQLWASLIVMSLFWIGFTWPLVSLVWAFFADDLDVQWSLALISVLTFHSTLVVFFIPLQVNRYVRELRTLK